MRRALVAFAALAALAHAGTSLAAGEFSLLAPSGPVTAPPPLAPGAAVQQSAAAPQTTIETRVPGRLEGRQLVAVGLGPDGTPLRVTVTQRLRIDGTGDYSFVIPAPATRVAAGPGSESLPGLRNVGIVWQGFSNRRRILSATASLRAKDAADGLPLRVHVEPQAGSTIVRLENVTQRKISAVTSQASRAAVLAAFDKLRAAARPDYIGGGPWFVVGEAKKATDVHVAAPLRVTGEITQGARRVAVDALLGGGSHAERSFTLPGSAPPALRLRVALPAPIDVLPTRREVARARRPLETLQAGLGAVATASAYRHFLATPSQTGATDPVTPSDATYVYRSVPKASAVAPRPRSDQDNTLAILLAVGLAALGLLGLAAWWARS